jgi:triacylglycerol lipase
LKLLDLSGHRMAPRLQIGMTMKQFPSPYLGALALVFLVGFLAGCVDWTNGTFGDSGGDSGGDDVGDDGGGDDGGDRAAPTAAFVLAHGFGGSATQGGFADEVEAALIAEGFAVLRSEVPSIESVEVRATALGAEIDQLLASSGLDRVSIIAHSMGGLDARYAISTLGYGDRVNALATVSTPHRGTPLADVALGLQGGDQQAARDLFAELAGGVVDPEAFDRAVADLTEAAAPAFNAANPDAAGVSYLSMAGFSTPGGIDNPNAPAACGAPAIADVLRPMLFLSAPIVADGTSRRPNDGVVPVDSGKWGSFSGCISADHIDAIGSLDTGNSGIDAVALYRELAAQLAAL